MKKSKRLQPVLHLAERNKKQAETALGNAQQQLAAEEEKLEQLRNYLAEYQQNAKVQQQQGVQVDILIRLQQFMSRLQEAVEQQGQQVELSRQMLTHAKNLWTAAYGRYKAMDSLIERSRQTELIAEDKQLQKTIDELTQNRKR
ncbi:flagellar export protein FliJ [Motiliproteus sp. MSK22-1]|uniref:flagellar export protein FliJ n=1 Tax=Motiliproteus sp. MSK22-1 TaxID=1897630 RepID=UPI0009787B72|nr:flagellar export protein FliJ [Motiliproteus sp. MSK22-1]OMH30037.1 flagellar export protein FliJ [Motiliproteus sp. MSK22-1]